MKYRIYLTSWASDHDYRYVVENNADGMIYFSSERKVDCENWANSH